ncbi:hypothetical protein [Devosia faecipullorum]|uniref:hypothetical protein n=1 Tax=Devosia faecipullorum TaxID=2755039 RepID=UPI00187BBAD1|nr:hypothetical protein [Devosia faecipullorum]MBE7732196.1 hypothetical protein [Devosia faecipullorum]
MSDDLETQYQQAILIDFYGPAERLERLAGLYGSDLVPRIREMELDPGITEILRPAHRRARALLHLVEERHGDAAADEALAAAIAAVRKSLAEMEAWSR